MSKKAQVAGSVVAGFPSPAEQYLEPPLDLNELLVKRPAATFFDSRSHDKCLAELQGLKWDGPDTIDDYC